MITSIHLLEILSNKEQFNHNYEGFYLGHDEDRVVFGMVASLILMQENIFENIAKLTRYDNLSLFGFYHDNNFALMQLDYLNNVSYNKDFTLPDEHHIHILENKKIKKVFNNPFYNKKLTTLFVREETMYSNMFREL